MKIKEAEVLDADVFLDENLEGVISEWHCNQLKDYLSKALEEIAQIVADKLNIEIENLNEVKHDA